MRNVQQLLKISAIVVGLILLVGCFANKTVEKRQYLLHTAQLKRVIIKATPQKVALFVAPVNVVAPFAQQNLLYRVSDNQYLIDYYNLFLIPPAQQIDDALRKYLQATGEFKIIAQSGSKIYQSQIGFQGYRHLQLQVKVLELYADYRDRNHPRAVIAMHVKVTRAEKNGAYTVLVDKTLCEAVPLQVKSVDNLFVAWDEGLAKLLESMRFTLLYALPQRFLS